MEGPTTKSADSLTIFNIGRGQLLLFAASTSPVLRWPSCFARSGPRAAAHALLPKQAENVEILSEATDAFPLDDWQSFETWFSYNLRGTKKVRWVLFVTMNPQRQVRLVADSDEKHFNEIHAAARAVLGSWFEPPAGWPVAAMLKAP